MDGLQVLRELQEQHPARPDPDRRDGLTDRVLGLELAPTTTWSNPSSPASWSPGCAPSCAATRRPPQRARPTGARFAGWHFDIGRLTLTADDGRELCLSAAEAALLQTLLKRPNKILTREQLIGERDLDPFDRSIDVHLAPAPQARGRPAGPGRSSRRCTAPAACCVPAVSGSMGLRWNSSTQRDRADGQDGPIKFDPQQRAPVKSGLPVEGATNMTRPFKVLGVQQIAIGGPSRTACAPCGSTCSASRSPATSSQERENVDEDITAMGRARSRSKWT